jgi:adenylate cyclase
MGSLFNELRRRNVFRVAAAYIVLGWLLLQIGDTLAPALRLPDWSNSLLAFLLLLGLPLAVFFAWAYELTPDGIRREADVDRSASIAASTGRKLDRVIIGMLVVAVAFLFVSTRDVTNGDSAAVVATADASTTANLAGIIEASEQAATSIAVLPFVNMSSDPEQEYFADGLSEELLNLLARIPALRVTSRSSAFYYKGKDVQIPVVGRELNVEHVLEGSVRRSGDTLRVTAQLIEVETDAHLWSDTWDRPVGAVFAIQDEISRAVVSELRIQLLDERPASTTTTPEAYSLYLRALNNTATRNEASLRSALDDLEAALEIDSNFAPAWAELGIAYYALGSIAEGGFDEKARGAAEKAVALDPNNSLAMATLANIAGSYDYDYRTAAQYIERGLARNPGDYFLLTSAANLAFAVGDYTTSLNYLDAAVLKDPRNSFLRFNRGYSLMYRGQPGEAREVFAQSLAITPDASGLRYYLACTWLVEDEYERALEALAEERLDGFRLTGEAIAHHRLGNAAAVRGELDTAFEWLDKAIEIRDRGLNLIVGDPFVDNLRGDPRFAEALRRLNRS